MTKSPHPVPLGLRNITPYLVARGAARLLDFVESAFGAQELIRSDAPGGVLMHAGVKIGDSMLEMGDIGEAESTTFRANLHYYAKDADSLYRQALCSGAKSLYQPCDRDYGDREAVLEDPCGNSCYIATHKNGTSYRPPLLPDLTLRLSLKDACKFIAFLEMAFHAAVVENHADAAGTIRHAKLRVGDTMIELSEAHDPWGPRASSLHYYTERCDEVFYRALATGAKLLWPLEDKLYGDRTGGLLDDWGNHWYISKHLEDLTLEEIQRRFQAAQG
jgi:uncharacterized glyoxalase superfamily protein PhnB